jgi:hypothetical protein
MKYKQFQFLASLAAAQGIKTIGEFKKFVENYNANHINCN